MRAACLLVLIISLASCAQAPETVIEPNASSSSSELAEFFDRAFQARLARSPILQTRLGLRDNYGEWDQKTEAAYDAATASNKAFLVELRERFDPATLNAADALSYRLFEYDMRIRIERANWRHHEYKLSHRNGVHTFVPSFLINSHKITNLSDAQAYVSRLKNVEAYFDQTIGQLRLAAANGVVPPALIFPAAIESAGNVLRGKPFDASGKDSVLRADFQEKLSALSLSSGQREQLLSQLDDVLLKHTRPAYERLIAYLGLLQNRAATDDGAWSLPEGADYYAFQLRRQTTTNLSPEEVHDLGLAEVARIHNEMRAIMRKVNFDGDLAAFFEFTRTDPQFFYPNTDAGRERYLNEATAYIDAMREQLDTLFGVKPKAALLVKRVEPFREKSAGKAFYGRPAADGSRPGIYYANLYQMNRMPIYQMQALAYHEGIPGHHMQIAIQQELKDVPDFRRFGTVTAFSEGWGLYSEWLPTDINAYADPYADFGRLAMELWRACRLVVDTGLHAKQWSVQQSIDYLKETTPNPEGDIINAVERYLVNPGQATAYKIGMLEIQAQRRKAEQALGQHFDIRDFHDAVLANGPIPLAILADVIDAHIADAAPGT